MNGDDEGVGCLLFAAVLAGVGAGIYGLSVLLRGLIDPLAGLLLSMGEGGPWPPAVAPLATLLVAFFVLRLLIAPLHVKEMQQSEVLADFLDAPDVSLDWDSVKRILFGLMLAAFDGIALFMVARTLQVRAPLWLEQSPWLLGGSWSAAGRGWTAVGVLAGGSAATVIGFLLLEELCDASDLFGLSYEIDAGELCKRVLAFDVCVYLPSVVGVVVVYPGNPFTATVVLAFMVVRVVSDLVLALIARALD